MKNLLFDAVQDAQLPFPVTDGTQSHPGELSREEAERLPDSKCFCTSSLPGWPEWKPLLIYAHEVDYLFHVTREQENMLEERCLFPHYLSINYADDVVYSTHEVEIFRSLLPKWLSQICVST